MLIKYQCKVKHALELHLVSCHQSNVNISDAFTVLEENDCSRGVDNFMQRDSTILTV